MQKASHRMYKPDDNSLQIGFTRALILSSVSISIFVALLIVIGVPLDDSLLRWFLILIVVSMPFVFAAFCCFLGRCNVEEEGLRGAVPWAYKRVLRWEEIERVRLNFPFYTVTGRGFGNFCVLPHRLLLKQPERMNQLIRKFAPKDNLLRAQLGLGAE